MNTLYYTVIVKKYSTNLFNASVFPLSLCFKITQSYSEVCSQGFSKDSAFIIECNKHTVLHFLPSKCYQVCLTPVQMCWILYSHVYMFLSSVFRTDYQGTTQSSTSPSVICPSAANRHSEGRKFQPWLIPSLPMWLLFLTAFGYFQNDNGEKLIAVFELKILAFPADSKL